jgi:hypothetical protein
VGALRMRRFAAAGGESWMGCRNDACARRPERLAATRGRVCLYARGVVVVMTVWPASRGATLDLHQQHALTPTRTQRLQKAARVAKPSPRCSWGLASRTPSDPSCTCRFNSEQQASPPTTVEDCVRILASANPRPNHARTRLHPLHLLHVRSKPYPVTHPVLSHDSFLSIRPLPALSPWSASKSSRR